MENYFKKEVDFIISAEKPDPNLYHFDGAITILD